ncbi:hypothetical protein bcere0025_52620 [Bacillus cereus F65185]|nr:hypothetical protein bcere0025_52620 [Bacillus cereus F65185]
MDIENWGTPKLRGRGMVKWQPFASIPKQHEEIREILEDLNKLPKPIVTEDMREQLERSLIYSKKPIFHITVMDILVTCT